MSGRDRRRSVSSGSSDDELPRRPPAGFDFSGSVVIYEYGDRRVYKIRDEFILKRTRAGGVNSEAATHQFVQDSGTGVPVPFVYGEWLSADGRWHHILEGRIHGQTLRDCWGRLSMEDKIGIAEQVAGHMARLGRIRGRALQSVSGRPLPHNVFVPRPVREHLGVWRTDDDIFAHEFRPALRRAGVAAEVVAVVRRTMPPCQGQFVLTHADLYVGNVMVDPASATVTAIIDWESAGFWPAWFQYARITLGCSPDDGEWKWILSRVQRKSIPHADHGRVWWHAVLTLLYSPDSLQAKAWLRLLVRYLRGEDVKLKRYLEIDPEPLRDHILREQAMLAGRGGRGDAGYYSTALGNLGLRTL